MITRLNELRHRLRFRLWTLALRAQLRRRGARLVVDAPHGARMDSAPHVGIAGSGGTFTLRIGRGVKLGRATHLDLFCGGDNVLEVGDGVYFMHGVRLQLRGGAIRLAAHVNLRDGVVLKSEGELRLGYEVPISFYTTIHCVREIVIGDRAGVGERCTIVDSHHPHHGDDSYFLEHPLDIGPVAIGPNSVVFSNAVIARGARIGANSVVAAGSVVGKGDYPDGWFIAGAPAKPLRELSGPA